MRKSSVIRTFILQPLGFFLCLVTDHALAPCLSFFLASRKLLAAETSRAVKELRYLLGHVSLDTRFW